MRRLSALHLAHDAVSTLQLVHVKPELQLSQSQSVPVLALSVTTSMGGATIGPRGDMTPPLSDAGGDRGGHNLGIILISLFSQRPRR